MKAKHLSLDGLILIELSVYEDERGHFTEWFKKSKLAEFGITADFKQDNYSRSQPQVIRGLHYQFAPAQGKLVGVARGQIVDVVVDIRASSKSYGKSLTIELNDRKRHLLWVPPGFAHGFAVIGNEPADVFYKCSEEYNAAGESGIRWNDSELAIRWPLKNPIVSQRDQSLQSFADYKMQPKFS